MLEPRPKLSKLKERYALAKSVKIGENCICPSCQQTFVKKTYQQAFCNTIGKSVCKDYYWNNVTPKKRNNTKRISPASAAFMQIYGNQLRFGVDAPNIIGGSGIVTGITSEGYRIMDGIAYDEWDDPVYDTDGIDEDDRGWDSHK